MNLSKFEGVINAQIVPTDDDGRPDLGALRELVAWQAERGVAALFAMGTAGQGPLFDRDERRVVLTAIAEAARAGSIAVIAHVGAMPTTVAQDLTADAIDIGVDAIASVPPTYYGPDRVAVSEYYRAIRDAAGGLPVFAYNNPPATSFDLRPDHAAELQREGIIDAVKLATKNVADVHDMLRLGVPLWIANAQLNTAALSMGAQGAISTITNVAPELFVELIEAVGVSDRDRVIRLQHRIDEVQSLLRHPIIGALHAGASVRGLTGGRPRPPLRLPTPEEMDDILRAVALATMEPEAIVP